MTAPIIRIVDDDIDLLEALSYMLASEGFQTRTYSQAQAFLENDLPLDPGCVILDFRMPDINGIELQKKLVENGYLHPIIFLTAHADVDMVISAFRRGADDLLKKPVDPKQLIEAVKRALTHDKELTQQKVATQDCAVMLTERETQISNLVGLGLTNTQIAERLGLSRRTIEVHRANIARKLKR